MQYHFLYKEEEDIWLILLPVDVREVRFGMSRQWDRSWLERVTVVIANGQAVAVTHLRFLFPNKPSKSAVI